MHIEEVETIERYADEYAVQQGYCATATNCSKAELARAEAELTQEALRRVDAQYAAALVGNSAADQFLASLAETGGTIAGTDQRFLEKDAYYNDLRVNLDYLDQAQLVDRIINADNVSDQTRSLVAQLVGVEGAAGYAPESLAQVLADPVLRNLLVQKIPTIDDDMLRNSGLIATAITAGSSASLTPEMANLQVIVDDPALRGSELYNLANSELELLQRAKRQIDGGDLEGARETLRISFNSGFSSRLAYVASVVLVGGGTRPTRSFSSLKGNVKAYLEERAAAAKPVSSRRTDGVLTGKSRVPSGRAIVRDGTVRLEQNIVTKNGQIIPAGSVVTENGGAIKIVTPGRQVITGKTDNLLGSQQLTLPPPIATKGGGG